MKMMGMRRRAYEILEVSEGDRVSRGFDIFIITLILFNIVALILETVESIYRINPFFFEVFEWVSVMIFTIEYVLRIWCAPESHEEGGPTKKRIDYVFSFYGLVDLMAILPFYLPLISADFRFLRGVRLFRLFRIFKLARYTFALSGLNRVLRRKKEELMCVGFLLMLLLVIASSLMFFLEHNVQPDTFSSIPATMWWGIVTLTTVGYGDVYPITYMGKVLGAVIAVLGIGLFALPAGLIGSAYLEELEERKNRKKDKLEVKDSRGETVSENASKHLALDIWLSESLEDVYVQSIRNFFKSRFQDLEDMDSEYSKMGSHGLMASDRFVVFFNTNVKEKLIRVDWIVQDPVFDFKNYRNELLNLLPVQRYSEALLLRGSTNQGQEDIPMN